MHPVSRLTHKTLFTTVGTVSVNHGYSSACSIKNTLVCKIRHMWENRHTYSRALATMYNGAGIHNLLQHIVTMHNGAGIPILLQHIVTMHNGVIPILVQHIVIK
jgi:hypothetical protein